MFKNIIIYSDCRGRGIYHFLKTKVNGNVKLIQICDLPNFKKDPSNFLVDKFLLNDLQTCDIFIYMFIRKRFEVYSTDPEYKNNMLSFLKEDCVKIGFSGPYIDCFWPLTNPIKKEYDVIFNKIKHLNRRQITKKFNNYDIDFNLKNRFDYCISHTKNDEQEWKDKTKNNSKSFIIKYTDFIINNFKQHNLFFAHVHPKSYLSIFMVNKILEIINNIYKTEFDLYTDIFSYPETFPNCPTNTLPQSNYIKKEFNIEWLNINKVNEKYYLKKLLKELV